MDQQIIPSTQTDIDFMPTPNNHDVARTSGEVAKLLEEYDSEHEKILRISEFMRSADLSGIGYFTATPKGEYRVMDIPTNPDFYKPEKAIKALDAHFWSRAMVAVDTLRYMPSEDKKVWNSQIEEHSTPSFESNTVIATLTGLYNSKPRFFAQRVDTVFKSLSPDHVTNSPSGFYKRMIIKDVMGRDKCLRTDKGEMIADLRLLVAHITGRGDMSDWQSSHSLFSYLESRYGDWVWIDGNALKIKLFKKGTVHIEVHPDVAWRMNQCLAMLYPMAIPAKHRKKEFAPKVKHSPIHKSVSAKACRTLVDLNVFGPNYKRDNYAVMVNEGSDKSEVISILKGIGGTGHENSYFDYDPRDVLKQIGFSGVKLDIKDFQYYPTTKCLSGYCARELDVQEGKVYIEPSAGQGGLAINLPMDSTLVEISQLNCTILKSKGFQNVICDDFIKWADKARSQGILFDGVLMNPPFMKGQAIEHVKAASQILKEDGKIVTILPSSLKGKEVLKGFRHKYSEVFNQQFDDIGVSVVVLTLTRTDTKDS